MANIFNKILNTKCNRCDKEIPKSQVHSVVVDTKQYTLCKECCWDVEVLLHCFPIPKFGDEGDVKVIPSENSKTET